MSEDYLTPEEYIQRKKDSLEKKISEIKTEVEDYSKKLKNKFFGSSDQRKILRKLLRKGKKSLEKLERKLVFYNK